MIKGIRIIDLAKEQFDYLNKRDSIKRTGEVMFKVFKEAEAKKTEAKKTEEKKKDVYFKLIDDYGDINLIAVNEKGEMITRGYILIIDKEGFLNVCRSTNKDIGLKLNVYGQIMGRE
jgi:hypothetical protein